MDDPLGYTPIPNDYRDALKGLDPATAMVGHVIAYQTWGWRKSADHVSYQQLRQWVPVSYNTIRRAVKRLEAKGLIVVTRVSNKAGNLYRPISRFNPPHHSSTPAHYSSDSAQQSSDSASNPAHESSDSAHYSSNPAHPSSTTLPTRVDTTIHTTGTYETFTPSQPQAVPIEQDEEDTSESHSSPSPAQSAQAAFAKRRTDRTSEWATPHSSPAQSDWRSVASVLGRLFRGKPLDWGHFRRLYNLANEHGLDIVALAREAAERDVQKPTAYLQRIIDARIKPADDASDWVFETPEEARARLLHEMETDAYNPPAPWLLSGTRPNASTTSLSNR